MSIANSVSWADPRTWPWILFVWLAFASIGWVKSLWRWTRRKRANSWPITIGQIDFVTTGKPQRSSIFGFPSRGTTYTAELSYSYDVAGSRYVGSYNRGFANEEEAATFIRDLKGKAVSVHHNPSKPSASALAEASLDTLLQLRAPKPLEEQTSLVKSDSVPEWLKPMLWPFIALSALGLVLSLWVHIGALMGRRVAPAALFFILHMGIFAVWIPAVLVAKKRVGLVNRGDYWKSALRGSPEWMRYVVYFFFGYALLNFVIFIVRAPTASGGPNPPAMVWRGFSGHWMVFYSMALAILYSAACAESSSPAVGERDSSLWGLRVLWITPVLFFVLFLGTFAFADILAMKSEAYKESIAIALSSTDVKRALGDDVKVRWIAPIGFSIPFYGSHFAQWSMGLKGSRGKGTIYGVANQINGNWEFWRLTFRTHDGMRNVDLTPTPTRLDLPPVPNKQVLILPIGLDPAESLDWVPAYYKAKLGVEVSLLPAEPLSPTLENDQRHQLDSDKCFDFITHRYPKLTRDPFVILIAVTSRDMYIPDYNWEFAENMRVEDRFAVISSARLHPSSLLSHLNPEWFNSRLQKLLTKNLLLLYFGIPMSADYTSIVSSGVLSGIGFDMMGGQLIGASKGWNSSVRETSDPEVTVYDIPGKPVLWKFAFVSQAVPDTNAQLFTADLSVGLFIQRKTDFFFDDQYPLQFTRVYTSNADRSRSFGVGAEDSLDKTLTGQMGYYVDVFQEDGGKTHFARVKSAAGEPDQLYREEGGVGQAVLLGNVWRVNNGLDGWTWLFPYRPQALPEYVTVLTSFTDPGGHLYRMERNTFGDLLSVTTPSGKSLHFENDAKHRIRAITSSVGRTVEYEYDEGSHLIRVKDSDGHEDRYTYDGQGRMLTVARGAEKPILTNRYATDGDIKDQTFADGRNFEYWTHRTSRNVADETEITDPNGSHTFIQYGPNGYTQSLPTSPPH